MKKNLLAQINKPSDLRKINSQELPQLAQELRKMIIDIVAIKAGHLGASLGVVELTIALHYIFDTPEDLLVWDVGHQAYGHKILTERKTKFHTNRQLNGLAGFPSRAESIYDTFGVGHASTSISAALGMAIASQLNNEPNKQHIAVIGDASIAGGMALEALNHAGVSDANILVILNDNEIGIDPNVGALKEYLTTIKNGNNQGKQNIFEALNFNYFGPVDGHNLEDLLSILSKLKTIKGPKFLHVITKKGKGLKQAEEQQTKYHAPGLFDKNTGETYTAFTEHIPPKYQDVFGLSLVALAKNNNKIVGITAAMPSGTSLKYMLEAFPKRAFDVGIAEQHAVTFAAGLATQGFKAYVAIYATFLQRAYDQIIHDVALQNLPVVFCIDRAGIVGEDGATHHGVFDISYLSLIPNMTIFAPMNEKELRDILYTSQTFDAPLAIRYPRGRGTTYHWETPFEKLTIGKALCVQEGNNLAVLTIGTIGNTIIELQDKLPKNAVAHYNMRFVKPLDEQLLHQIFKQFNTILTIEEGSEIGGFGSQILTFANTHRYTNKIETLAIADEFITHGTVAELKTICGLDKESIYKKITRLLCM
jgi:1-deoxy-D-xylulose-5-phosphate synthase